jgi:hypothetical protein
LIGIVVAQTYCAGVAAAGGGDAAAAAAVTIAAVVAWCLLGVSGVPSFFAHLPVLGGMLRRVSLHTIQRLVEDILVIVSKVLSALFA